VAARSAAHGRRCVTAPMRLSCPGRQLTTGCVYARACMDVRQRAMCMCCLRSRYQILCVHVCGGISLCTRVRMCAHMHSHTARTRATNACTRALTQVRQRIQARNERGKSGSSGGVLVVGGEVASGLGFVAASPNEEARIAREAAEASRLERLRQVRLQVSLFLPSPPLASCSASRHFPLLSYAH
jgi:hypothetical protein